MLSEDNDGRRTRENYKCPVLSPPQDTPEPYSDNADKWRPRRNSRVRRIGERELRSPQKNRRCSRQNMKCKGSCRIMLA